MPVDAVGVVRARIDEISGQPGHYREFVSGLRIEIRVTDAPIDGPVAEAKVRKPRGIIGSDRNIAGHIDHEIVDAAVPTQRRLGKEIGESPALVTDAAAPRRR